MSGTERKISRREFIKRSAGAGALIAAGAGAGVFLTSSAPPPIIPPPKTQAKLKDYAMPGVGALLAVAQGTERKKTLYAALKGLGGMGRFIKKGETVLIKVNAAFASPPMIGATTHPEILAALISQVKAAGAGRILVADNPINDPPSCFLLSGLGEAARAGGAELILPRPSLFKPATVPGGRLIRQWPFFAAPMEAADRVIGLAPVKDHHRSGASLSMKNWYGLLGGQRSSFHQDINGIIFELAKLVKPTMVILDATVSMMTNGPTGGSLDDLRRTGRVIAATDQVAADTFAATLLGKGPRDLPWLSAAAGAGLGTTDYKSLKPGFLGGK